MEVYRVSTDSERKKLLNIAQDMMWTSADGDFGVDVLLNQANWLEADEIYKSYKENLEPLGFKVNKNMHELSPIIHIDWSEQQWIKSYLGHGVMTILGLGT